jgi:pectin methylesterase-like acyl-CoA thioesterase
MSHCPPRFACPNALALALALAAYGCGDSSPSVPAAAGTGAAAAGNTGSQTPAASASGAGGSTTSAIAGRSGSNVAGTSPSATAGRSGSAGTSPPASTAGATGAAGQTAPEAGSGGMAGASPVTPTPSTGPLFPANGARDVCADAPLRLHFSGAPSVGSSGKISVFEAASSSTPVATVDLAVANVNATIGGTAFKVPRPIYVDGNDVIVRLPPRALMYGHTYYVNLDAGAIKGPDGASMTITDSMTWRFDTAAAAPSALAELRVAVDGTGQFCSVQGALDAVPARSTTATTITIENGTYFEIIHAASKNNVTLRGRDRKQTIILGVNNDALNPGTATRSLVGIDGSTGFVVENLTIHNLTPQGGTQAEALRMQSCDQCVVRHADIISLQDTLLWSGRIYANDCYIEGNVDFVWGTGAAFFENCEIKTVGRAGYVVQARNTAGKSGYVFVDSKITAGPGVTGIVLGRIDVSVYPASHVAYINCQMGSHIAPAGWTITGGAAGASLRFLEYKSTDASGAALDVSRRIAGSKQLTDAEATQARSPAAVLDGWMPPK